METNKTDKLLEGFFSEYKQEIADNGFTQRVMQRLPEQTYRGWIVWIFAAMGMAITIYLGITIGLVDQILSLLKHVPVYYLIAGVFCFPLVGTAGFYFSQNKNYGLI
jgi:hypothetical protein